MANKPEDEDRPDSVMSDVEDAIALSLPESEIMAILLSLEKTKLHDLVPKDYVISSANATKVALYVISNSERRTHLSLSRLTWLTGIVQYGLVENITELRKLFVPFIALIKKAKLHARACQLVASLATASIFKWQVEMIANTEAAMGRTKPLTNLLGRLKELRPDLVPYGVGSQTRFGGFQHLFERVLSERAANLNRDHQLGVVMVGSTSEKRRGTKKGKKMRLDIVPRPEFISLKPSVEVDLERVVLVTAYQSPEWLARNFLQLTPPNQISSLLFIKELHPFLAMHYKDSNARSLDQWVYITLFHEFMEKPQTPESDAAKELLLKQILSFQRTTGVRLNVVFLFLSEYLKTTWDGQKFSSYILDLLRDLPFSSFTDLHECFLVVLEQMYHEGDAIFRDQVISVCVDLIENLINQRFGTWKKTRKVFLHVLNLPDEVEQEITLALNVIADLIEFTQRLCNAGITSSSARIDELLSALRFHIRVAGIEEKYGLPFVTFCQPIIVYMAVMSMSPACVSLICRLFVKYRSLARRLLDMIVPPFLDDFRTAALMSSVQFDQYISDAAGLLFFEQGLTDQSPSFVVMQAPPQVLSSLQLGDKYRKAFTLQNHPAFVQLMAKTAKEMGTEDMTLDELTVVSLTRLLDQYEDFKNFFALCVAEKESAVGIA